MKSRFSLLFVAFAFMLVGCGEHFDEVWGQIKDSIVPGLDQGVKDELKGLIPASVIPNSIRNNIKGSMPLNEGTDPPDIKGQYVQNNNTLVGSSLSYDIPGRYPAGVDDTWSDVYVAFIEGSKSPLSYRERQEHTTSGSDDITLEVVGSGNDFTAYFISEGVYIDSRPQCDYNIKYKQSTVISGTVTSSGIENFHYSFIILEKSSDPLGCMMPVDAYRVFEDGDGLAERVSWLQ
jgi:hypothetical protein